jgi:hypothetical protein
MKLYIEDIAQCWRKEISSGPEVAYVLSPYITSNTAESVLSGMPSGHCEIYTIFSAELFASKASSLKTLKNLMALGHRIFHLPSLHAKIVLIPGLFASIGSQNLTDHGTRNKEANISLSDKKIIEELESLIKPWLNCRVLVTHEMICDMEEMLDNIRQAYQKAQLDAEKADETVFQQQKQRDADAEQRAREEEQRLAQEAEERQLQRENELLSQRRILLKSNISKTAQSEEDALGVVQVVAYSKKSLVSLHNRDFTRWKINNISVLLDRGKRHIFIMEDSGKLGLARVMRHCITFVGQGVRFGGNIALGEFKYKISINGDWAEFTRHGRNISIEIYNLYDSALCVVSAWFSIYGLDIIRIERLSQDYHTISQSDHVMSWIERNHYIFEEECLKLILMPFVYGGKRLHGVQADTFFGSIGSKFILKVVLVGDSPILIGKQITR